jgi:hypothetical protein
MINVSTEHPYIHWRHVDVENRTVLDLGCGRWSSQDAHLSTAEFFIKMYAKRVIGVDCDHKEIIALQTKLANVDLYEFIEMRIDSAQKILRLYEKYKPDCVKCDIEGCENLLFKLSDEVFNQIEEYYIETHGLEMYEQCIERLKENNYTIREQLNLTHTNNHCKVIFAFKKEK